MLFREKYWHDLFEASILIKAVNGIWETASGLALLLISGPSLTNHFRHLARRELAEKPQDFLIHFINSQIQHLTNGTKDFTGIYILAHGIVNLFLAYNLYRDRLWAYLVSLYFVGFVLLYLIYRAMYNHSLWLLGIIIFDTIFMILTWHEYRYRMELLIAKNSVI